MSERFSYAGIPFSFLLSSFTLLIKKMNKKKMTGREKVDINKANKRRTSVEIDKSLRKDAKMYK